MAKKTKKPNKNPKQVTNQLTIATDKILVDTKKKYEKKKKCETSKRFITDEVVKLGSAALLDSIE